MGRKLAAMGVRSCGDLLQVSLSQLQKKFGPRTGQTLFRFCRGLDDRPVRYEKERKSVSAEMNYNIRFTKVQTSSSSYLPPWRSQCLTCPALPSACRWTRPSVS